MLLVQSFLVAMALGGNTPVPFEEPIHSGKPRLEVVVRSAAGEALSGVALILCPFDSARPRVTVPSDDGDTCTTSFSDVLGRAAFERVKPGLYSLTAQLSGFATTSVYPLSIAGPDPIAPETVVALLNPVCFHCVPPAPTEP